jgi:hypothetical protein
MGVWKTIRSLWRTFWRLLTTGWRAWRGAPLVGEIKGRYKVEPAVIEDPRFGNSSARPQVLEIIVSDEEQWPLGVGKIVNEIFFDRAPPIIFNVCFSCHETDDDDQSDYANPESHWFNVFFGFYEIDVPAAEWGRPFGFKNATDEWEIEFDDLLRIGKSDWNYFSNYMYGVPWWKACGCNRLDDSGVKNTVLDREVDIAGVRYVECEVDGMEVVSAHRAGEEKLRRNVTFITKVWQKQFGTCEPKPGFGESFFPVRMRMRFLIGWKEEHDFDLSCMAYKTFIYGGSINKHWEGVDEDRKKFNDEFLQAQMTAVREAAATMEQQGISRDQGGAVAKKRKRRRPR